MNQEKNLLGLHTQLTRLYTEVPTNYSKFINDMHDPKTRSILYNDIRNDIAVPEDFNEFDKFITDRLPWRGEYDPNRPHEPLKGEELYQGVVEAPENIPKRMWEALRTGWNDSISGMALTGELPEAYIPTGWLDASANSLARIAGDAIIWFPATLGVEAAGAAAGSSIPLLGTVGGALAVSGTAVGTGMSTADVVRTIMKHKIANGDTEWTEDEVRDVIADSIRQVKHTFPTMFGLGVLSKALGIAQAVTSKGISKSTGKLIHTPTSKAIKYSKTPIETSYFLGLQMTETKKPPTLDDVLSTLTVLYGLGLGTSSISRLVQGARKTNTSLKDVTQRVTEELEKKKAAGETIDDAVIDEALAKLQVTPGAERIPTVAEQLVLDLGEGKISQQEAGETLMALTADAVEKGKGTSVLKPVAEMTVEDFNEVANKVFAVSDVKRPEMDALEKLVTGGYVPKSLTGKPEKILPSKMNEEQQKLEKINRKLERGKNLTADEAAFKRMADAPETYVLPQTGVEAYLKLNAELEKLDRAQQIEKVRPDIKKELKDAEGETRKETEYLTEEEVRQIDEEYGYGLGKDDAEFIVERRKQRKVTKARMTEFERIMRDELQQQGKSKKEIDEIVEGVVDDMGAEPEFFPTTPGDFVPFSREKNQVAPPFTYDEPEFRKPMKHLLKGKVLNAYAGKNRLSDIAGRQVDEVRNDKSLENNPDFNMDAIEFALWWKSLLDSGKRWVTTLSGKRIKVEKFDTLVYDPPFSMWLDRSLFKGKTMSTKDFEKLRTEFKDAVEPILKDDARVISIGHGTSGMFGRVKHGFHTMTRFELVRKPADKLTNMIFEARGKEREVYHKEIVPEFMKLYENYEGSSFFDRAKYPAKYKEFDKAEPTLTRELEQEFITFMRDKYPFIFGGKTSILTNPKTGEVYNDKAGVAIGKYIQWLASSRGDVPESTPAHELFHPLLRIQIGRGDKVALEGIRMYESQEALVEEVAKYSTGRIKDKAAFARIKAWLQEFWSSVKVFFNANLTDKDIVRILSHRFLKGAIKDGPLPTSFNETAFMRYFSLKDTNTKNAISANIKLFSWLDEKGEAPFSTSELRAILNDRNVISKAEQDFVANVMRLEADTSVNTFGDFSSVLMQYIIPLRITHKYESVIPPTGKYSVRRTMSDIEKAQEHLEHWTKLKDEGSIRFYKRKLEDLYIELEKAMMVADIGTGRKPKPRHSDVTVSGGSDYREWRVEMPEDMLDYGSNKSRYSHMGTSSNQTIAWIRTDVSEVDAKTLRVLEMQRADLFRKDRLETAVADELFVLSEQAIPEILTFAKNKTLNNFLVRAIIQKAAEDGFERVRFPDVKTMQEIEGHTRYAADKRTTYEAAIRPITTLQAALKQKKREMLPEEYKERMDKLQSQLVNIQNQERFRVFKLERTYNDILNYIKKYRKGNIEGVGEWLETKITDADVEPITYFKKMPKKPVKMSELDPENEDLKAMEEGAEKGENVWIKKQERVKTKDGEVQISYIADINDLSDASEYFKSPLDALIKQRNKVAKKVEKGESAPEDLELAGKDIEHQTQLEMTYLLGKYNVGYDHELFKSLEHGLSRAEKVRFTKLLNLIQENRRDKDKLLELKMQEPKLFPKAQEQITYFESMRKLFQQHIRRMIYRKQKPEVQTALDDLLGGMSIDEVLANNPRVKGAQLKDAVERMNDTKRWGLEDYVTHIMMGQFEIRTKDGSIITRAATEADAKQKILDIIKNHPEQREFIIDTSFKPKPGDIAELSPRAYNTMIQRLSANVRKSVENISKAAADDIARAQLAGTVKVTQRTKFVAPLAKSRKILPGEENIFDVIYAYSRALRMKMATDEAIMNAREYMLENPRPENITKLFNETIVAMNGSYSKWDRTLDQWFKGTAPFKFSRFVAKARSIEANLKLGYRPVATAVNIAGGLAHIITKVGTPYLAKAEMFMRTPEGKEFIHKAIPYLGTTYALEDKALGPSLSWWKPLAFYQWPEKGLRERAITANYLYAREVLKMTDSQAFTEAWRGMALQQFIYSLPSIPRFLRSPQARLVGQFKTYLAKELEFISSLRGKEIVRHLAFMVATGGPRSLLYMIGTIPLLHFWLEDKKDFADYLLNVHGRILKDEEGQGGIDLARGMPGIFGVDITAPSVPQFPTRMEDWFGPTLADLIRLGAGPMKDLVTGSDTTIENVKQWALDLPIYLYYIRQLFPDSMYGIGLKDKDGWIRDERGNKIFKPEAWEKYLNVLAVSPSEKSMIALGYKLVAQEQEKLQKEKNAVADRILNYIRNDKSIPSTLMTKAIALGISGQSMQARARWKELNPQQRLTLMRSRMFRLETWNRVNLLIPSAP